ncbi:MAG: hypothetical protein ACXAB2_09915 [Candidatus Hodarchaeales archaeon]|jgi:hypothetical protein
MSDLNRFLQQEVGGKEKSIALSSKKKPRIFTRSKLPTKTDDLSKKDILNLLEPVFALIPDFTANLAWARQNIVPKNPKITPEELAGELSIPLLEAYFILDRLKENYSSESEG